MSPLVTLPNNLQDGVDVAYGSQVKANDDAIVQVVHNLDYQNIKPGANLQGAVISSTPGSRLPTDRIEDDAVTADKLKDDSSSGSPQAAVNTAHHIKDGIITKGKMVTAAHADALTANQLKLTQQSVPFSFVLGGATVTGSGGTGTSSVYACSVDRKTNAGNYEFNVRGMGKANATNTVLMGAQSVVPTTTLPVATTIILAAYAADLSWNAGASTLSGNLIILSIPVS